MCVTDFANQATREAEDKRAGTGFANEREAEDTMAATDFSNERNAKRKTDHATGSDLAKEREAQDMAAGPKVANEKIRKQEERAGSDCGQESPERAPRKGEEAVLEALWRPLEASRGIWGRSWGHVGAVLCQVGAIWGGPGASLGGL